MEEVSKDQSNEESKQPNNDLILNFSDNTGTTTLIIEDTHKLARLLYELCIDNKLGVKIVKTDK